MQAGNGLAGQLFRDNGVTRRAAGAGDPRGARQPKQVTTQNPEAAYQALENCGRDLTQMAAQGKLDPVINGRDDEIPAGESRC